MATLRAKITVLGAALIVAAAGLVGGCREQADPKPASQPPASSEEPESALEPESTLEPEPPSGAELKLHNWQEWWSHAREVLFSGIELSAEQTRQIDAIIADELAWGAELQQRDAELNEAREARDRSRLRAARRALRESRAQVRETYEVYEELRAQLTREQWPAFDMNRARLVAESQASADQPAERSE